MDFAKPLIVISKCLEFDACRYNGASINDKIVRSLKKHVQFIPVCPEVEIGLGTPRDPIRLVKKDDEIRLVQPSTKLDVTTKMNKFSMNYLSKLEQVDGFIFKNRSPSCGLLGIKVYAGFEKSSVSFTDKGIFAKAVLKQFPNTPMEEEGRLTNREIREHFLTAIYTLAKFRKEIAQPSRRKLIEFHSANKYLFMMYNQTIMRKMGKLLASLSDRKLKETINLYYEMLKKLFSRKPSRRSVINVHMHAMGFFSKDLNTKEKSHFLRMLEKLRNQLIPISAVNSILESWLARYEQPYLSKQTFFQPFPQQLIMLIDSGKGRIRN